MRKRRAFGEARRAGRILNVDRLVELAARFALGQRHVVAFVGPRQKVVPADLVRSRRFCADDDDVAQRGEGRTHVAHHGEVLTALVAIESHEGGDAALLQRVLQFVQPVRRVHVDEDRADLGARVLHQHPLERVRRPDSDAFAVLHAGRDKGAGKAIGLVRELGIAEAAVLVDRNDGIAIRKAACDPVQVVADRFSEKRHGARPVSVGRKRHT